MKTTISTILTLLAAASIVPALAGSQETHGDPYTPVGSLNVSKRLVRTGVKPMLSWTIKYPTKVTDLVELRPRQEINPLKQVRIDIRVAGVAYKSNYGHGNNTDGVDSYNPGASTGTAGSTNTSGYYDDEAKGAHVKMKINEGEWSGLFGGDSYQVQPTEPVYSAVVKQGELLALGASLLTDEGDVYTPLTSLTLTNGDPLPLNPGSGLNAFLTPYVNEDLTVNLGPHEILCLFELDATNITSSNFDYQDLAVVVTVTDLIRNGDPLASR